MINTTNTSELLSTQTHTFDTSADKLESVNVESPDKITDKSSSESNPANFALLSKISSRANGSDMHHRNTIDSISLINTALDTSTSIVSDLEDMKSDIGTKTQLGVGPKDDDSLFDALKQQLSVYENAEKIDLDDATVGEQPSNPLAESMFSDKAVNPSMATIDKAIEYMTVQVNELDEFKKKLGTDLDDLVEKRVSSEDTSSVKWDSIKAELASSQVQSQISSDAATSMQSQANISPQETLALLK